MTTDDSIWGVPCPSDLKRNKNVFIIGATHSGGSHGGESDMDGTEPTYVKQQEGKYGSTETAETIQPRQFHISAPI